MKIKWCGVFKNTWQTPKYPPYYSYTDTYLGQTAADIKMAIEQFVYVMSTKGMKLVDQEILDVTD